MDRLLIGCGIAALMVYAVAAQPSGKGWAYARLLTLSIAATCALTVGAAYDALIDTVIVALLLRLGLLLYLARAAWLQWRLLRAGDYAAVIELSSRAIKLRRLAEEIATDRAWIAARLERTFTSQEDVENVVREMRGRQQQIEQRQAKLVDLRFGFKVLRNRKVI